MTFLPGETQQAALLGPGKVGRQPWCLVGRTACTVSASKSSGLHVSRTESSPGPGAKRLLGRVRGTRMAGEHSGSLF